MTSPAAEDANVEDIPASTRARHPLAHKVLVSMAIRLMVVTVALTGFGYVHVSRAVTGQILDGFSRFIQERGERESEVFLAAEDNHVAIRTALVDELRAYAQRDPTPEFEYRYEVKADGTIVCRKERFDATKQASCVSDPGMQDKIDADLRRRVLSANSVIDHYGAAYHARFMNTWFTTVDGVGFMYWPENPTYYAVETNQDDSAGDDDYLTPASPGKNPHRNIIWTKSYFDQVSKLMVVSITTPAYDGDRFLGVIGHDIPLKKLLDRTLSTQIDGTYSFLLRNDGYLIAHPLKVAELDRAHGALDVSKEGEPELLATYRMARDIREKAAVMSSEDGRSYLGIAKIAGPNWFLVSVYPKKLVEDAAWSTARFILLGGLVSLAIELLLFYSLLKNHITEPLTQLRGAIGQVTLGNRAPVLDTARDDELGELAASFLVMAKAVDEREKAQKEAEEAIVVLNRELELNLEREKERNEQLVTLQREVDEHSTPVLEVAKHVLALPIIGLLDSTRGQKIMDRLLDAIVAKKARLVILDVTGTRDIDETATEQLSKVVSAARLLGAKCVLTGVRANVARTMVMHGADLQSVETLASLGQALERYFGSQFADTK
ncbi:MAG TPA: cache domain-containing protein [Polyangium sp.]|nr:cache domain-containing protein [Polyangium sp.]